MTEKKSKKQDIIQSHREVMNSLDETEVEAVRVESVRKPSKLIAVLSFIVRWGTGLYVIGLLSAILEIVFRNGSAYLYSYATHSTLFNSELSPLLNFVRSPILILTLIVPFVLIVLLTTSLLKYAVDKANFFVGKEKQSYLLIAYITIGMSSLLTYL